MGKKTQVGSIPESLGDICNTGGKELRLFRRGGSAFRAGTKKSVVDHRDLRHWVSAICLCFCYNDVSLEELQSVLESY